MGELREAARVQLPTVAGEFDARAFTCGSGYVYLALIKGDLSDGRSVLTRVHSECLTGDALGSLRCDCGAQLDLGMRALDR
jgi:GTP cyclohydrolase II